MFAVGKNYRAELKAQIARAELAEQHNEAIGQLGEQAAGREVELKQLLAESSAALKVKEREVRTFRSPSPRPKSVIGFDSLIRSATTECRMYARNTQETETMRQHTM